MQRDLTDQERVQKVLRELRERGDSIEVKDDVKTLEKLLSDPVFQQLSQKPIKCKDNDEEDGSSILSPAEVARVLQERLREIRAQLEPNLLRFATSNQVLLFTSVTTSDIESLILKTNETKKLLSVEGPKDIKNRSAGRIHVGDQILAVDHIQLPFTDPESERDAPYRSHLARKKRSKDGDSSGVSLATSKHSFRSVLESNTTAPKATSKSDNTANIRIEFPDLLSAAGILHKYISDVKNHHQQVILALLRDSSQMVLSGDWIQIELIRLINEPGIGFGFGIVGGTSTGVVVKTILPGSAADKDKRLRPGDHILKIGNVNVHGMSSQQVATILRQQDSAIDLVVGRTINNSEKTLDTPSCWTMPTRSALCSESLEDRIQKQIFLGETAGNQPLRSGTPETKIASTAPSTHNQFVPNNLHQPLEGRISDNSYMSASNVPSRASFSLITSVESDRKDSNKSLRQLQELALTVFNRDKWTAGSYETVEVELLRDPVLGLGITVAGYVHKKEEINGVFVKSLVPESSAYFSKKIQLHDLITEVNGKSLEKMSHADSVRTLVKSGMRVKLKLIRFLSGSSQAECLRMLEEQETATQVIDVQSNSRDVVAKWRKKLGADYEVVSVDLLADKSEDGGLGISLEGTVDVVDGTQLCPHHYIDSLRSGGPAALSNALRAGDELLQVNEFALYGESHITVRQALSRAAASAQKVRLTVARRAQIINFFMPRPEKSLPIAYPILAAGDDRLIKAKSDSCITSNTDNTALLLEMVSRRLRSRSLQPFTGLAIWKCVPITVYLEKDIKGLGFSVIDYQDPLHPGGSVIVIRSLVPGGVAQADGRIVPGDRLMFVNDVDLSNSTLDFAVAVLKAAPQGIVRLGIAKPVPVDQNWTCGHSPIISRSERLMAQSSSPISRRRKLHRLGSQNFNQEEVWIDADHYRRQHPQEYYPSCTESPTSPRAYSYLNSSHLSMASWSPCSTRSVSPSTTPVHLRYSWAPDVVYLPSNLERSIKIQKGALSLGLVVDAEVDKGINGCQVKNICNKKAVGRDGRVQVGDYLVKINSECLRNVTNSKARAILKRTNLIGTQCNITYITWSDAKLWKERYHQENENVLPIVSRLSPKVFPKFYRSPFMSPIRKESFDSDIFGSDQSESNLQNIETSNQETNIINEKVDLGKFAEEISQIALKEALIEVIVAENIPDWTGSICKSKTSYVDSRKLITEQIDENKEPIDSQSSSSQKCFEIASTSDLLSSDANITSSKSKKFVYESGTLTINDSHTEEKISDRSSTENSAMETDERKQKHLVTLSSDEVKDEEKVDNNEEPTVSHFQSRLSRSKFWDESRTVVLNREIRQSFGVSIVGGRVEVGQKNDHSGIDHTVSGIFIKSVLPDSPAGRSGMMNMGDRVISVNGIDLRNATHEQAVNVIRNAKNPVHFVLQSLHSFCPQHHQEIDKPNSSIKPITDSEQSYSTSGLIEIRGDKDSYIGKIYGEAVRDTNEYIKVTHASTEVPSFDESTSEPQEMKAEESRSRRKSDVQKMDRDKIDKESAANLPRLDDDPEKEDRFFYTKDKIKRKYEHLPGDVILLKLHRVPRDGLGLSLAGECSHEELNVHIVAVNPTCPLPAKIGDVLLEVNGQVLLGLSHLIASAKIRECSETGSIYLLLLRKFTSLDEMAMKDEPKLGSFQEESPVTFSNIFQDRSGRTDNIADKEIKSSPSRECREEIAEVDMAGPRDQQNVESNEQRRDENRKKSWNMERTACIETGKETLIEIDKDGKGLGLSIVGGCDTVLGTVVIHEVYSDGAAAMDGRLKAGDQVLEANNISLRGVTHEQAISLLRRTPSKVRLLVYRDINLQLSLLDPTQIYNIFEVELTKKPGRGLGLSIVGRKNEPGVYVSEIVKGGAAEADARLMQGDQILAVNGQDVTNSMQEDVAAMLKACVGRVSLKLGRWKLTEAVNRELSTPDTTSLKETCENNYSSLFGVQASGNSRVTDNKKTAVQVATTSRNVPQVMVEDDSQCPQILHSDLSPVTEEPSSGTDQKSLVAEEESSSTASHSKEIELIKDLREDGCESLLILLKKYPDQQLGMGIGKRTRGILVTSLQPGSVAAEKLKVGDRLMAVNGLSVVDQLSAVTLVKASGERLWLQISRPRISSTG